MANKHLVKRSSVTGRAPQASELDFGELALNFADGKLYFKDASGNLQFFTTGGEAEPATTISTTAPSNPQAGDLWWNSEDAALYIYYTDADSSQWVVAAQGGMISTGTDLTAVSSSVVPTGNEIYDLGSPGLRWRDLYLSGSTINLGGATIKTDAASGAIALLPQPTIENPSPSGVVISATGGISVVETVDGEIAEGAIEQAANDVTAAPVPIDITTTPPQDGQALVWQAANSVFVPGNVASGGGGSSLDVYATIAELPLSGVDTGTMAFVSGNNRLYIWNGTGWFNIALINTNPTITGGANPSYTFSSSGTPIVITLTASDPEGIPLTWSYQVTSGTLGNTATVSQSNNVFTITPSTNTADAGGFQLTFSASDGVNVATTASSFTLRFAAADPYYNQSVLLSTTNTNNGTNSTFVDSSTNNFAVTRNGNTTQGTFSPFSPVGWSGYFDGSNDLISIPGAGTPLTLDGDFTVEFWVYPTALAASTGYHQLIMADNNSYSFKFWRGGAFYYYDGTNSYDYEPASTIQNNGWYHIAWVRSGNTSRVYVNGVSTVQLTTFTGTVLWSTNLRIGGVVSGTESFPGYISNVRVVKGTRLYNANFTPPEAPLTVIPGTSLLTLQDNRFKDNSTNNYAVTRVGDTRITPFSPFVPTVEYSPSLHGGSAYFDGSGDFLSVANNSALQIVDSANFTVEAWVYPTAFSGGSFGGTIVSKTSGNNGWLIRLKTDGQYSWVQPNVAEYAFGPTGVVALNTWHHIAIVKLNGSFKGYINGVGYSFSPANISETTNAVNIGFDGFGPFTGYISNVRIVKGTAIYTTNFTPPTAPVEAVSGTGLLVNFANANIYDQTGKIVAETLGDAKTSTASVKYGITSMAFDGTGDYLRVPSSTELDFGTGNFTIETWVNFAALSSNRVLLDRWATGNANAWQLYWRSTGTSITFLVGSSTILVQDPNASNITTGTWNHIAVTRSGTTVRLFVNGIVVATATSSLSLTNTLPLGIGVQTSTVTNFLNGHLQDVRITRGYARYTANFTPPTAKLDYSNAQ